MKFISWNVNGIRAAWNHGLEKVLIENDADIYAIQETKLSEPISVMELSGYQAFWSFCDSRKGYSGTLCLTKIPPIDVFFGFGENKDFDCEGRIITLEFTDFYFVNCYYPNSQGSELRHDYRAEWDKRLDLHLQKLRFHKSVILCGDFNVAVSDNDIYIESKWQEINSEGFLSEERESLNGIFEQGFVDTYRLVHPHEKDKFTWWSNRKFKRNENRSWRLDYFLCTQDLCQYVTESTMLFDTTGSDHCPIVLEMDIPMKFQRIELQPKAKKRITYSQVIGSNRYSEEFLLENADLTRLWNSIDWDIAEKRLTEMQKALAKSTYTYIDPLIKKWQRKILSSIDAKILAVRHVCSSTSGKGVDNVRWTTSEDKMRAALALWQDDYKTMPSRLLLITSKNNKQRRIHIETQFDRAMQTLHAFALDPIAETWGESKSFAYRRGRSAFDMNEYIKMAFSGENAPEWVFIGDIRKCFENINHDWIKRHIPLNEYMLEQFLSAGYIYSGELFPTDVGVGIGCTLSPIIANMVLDGLQKYIHIRLYNSEDEIDYSNGNMIRYADDIIVAARSYETAEQIREIISEFLAFRGLELSPEKSKIINVNDGFTFMSRAYFKSGDMLLAAPSEESVARFMDTMKSTIENFTGSQKTLIDKLNKKIDGWTTYHKVSEASNAFRKLDVYIKALLLDLCQKRHPKWKKEKILDKYWYMDADGRYIYALPNKREVRVKFLSDTLLTDYTPIKVHINPYVDFNYMEKRLNEREINNATGIYRSIWERQNGCCYYCGRKILKDEKKALIEIAPYKSRKAARYGYVHVRCVSYTLDEIETDVLPDTSAEVMALLEQLESDKKPIGMKYLPLADHFRNCSSNSVTLSIKEIEKILGFELGQAAHRKDFWTRTGMNTISNSWVDNGYRIVRMHLEDRPRIVFGLVDRSRNTSSVNIPNVIKYGKIPDDAKYELENYFNYIIKKYGL